MRHLNLFDLINFARKNSPYYRKLYQNLAEKNFSIEDVPLVQSKEFWEANGLKDNQLLTGPIESGIVFKSGGTTGMPKFSVFSKEEWHAFTDIFGKGMKTCGISDGDKVANLFYAGDLYASFLFINKSIEQCPLNLTVYPLTGGAKSSSVIEAVLDHGINVLLGVPTTIMQLAGEFARNKEACLKITKIFYGGETLFDDQRDVLRQIFTNARIISSIGYASVDAGHLGHAVLSEIPGEHGVFLSESLVELLDAETLEPITKVGIAGKLVYTNLARTLMPIIRYAVGDEAEWTEVGARFKILGRTEEGIRLGPVTLTTEEIRGIVKNILGQDLMSIQSVVDRKNTLDHLCLRIATRSEFSSTKKSEMGAKIIQAILMERSMLGNSIEKNIVAMPDIEFCDIGELEKNPRTGKLKIVLDRRF